MHDHSTRGKRFCPMMKEWCNQGWTPAMGFDGDGDEKMPKLGICAAWQPVSLISKSTQESSELCDCSMFGWLPDLLTEVSGKIGVVSMHVANTTNEVAKQHGTMIALASPDKKLNLTIGDPRRKLLPQKSNNNE